MCNYRVSGSGQDVIEPRRGALAVALRVRGTSRLAVYLPWIERFDSLCESYEARSAPRRAVPRPTCIVFSM